MKASKIEKFLTKLAETKKISNKQAKKRLESLGEMYANLTVQDQRLKVRAKNSADAAQQEALQEQIKTVDSQRRRSLRFIRLMVEQLES